ncbi:MAG: DNA alkylation repair protein, partial [Planctomycetes bacterium]|nr:DNA alkylation repair protein [Planctomycetota bacterium]
MSDLLLNLRKELQTKIEPDFREGFINFFKEKVKPLGIRSRHLQIITRNYRKFLPKEKKDFFHLLQKILSADWHEEIYIAFKWLFLRRKELVKKDFSFLEQCLKKHITNWAHCDDFSTHPLG